LQPHHPSPQRARIEPAGHRLSVYPRLGVETAVAALPTRVTVTNTSHAPQYRCTRRGVTGHSRRPARRSGNYGLVTGAKPDGVVAVTLGVATLVSGTGGGVVVTVCPVACGATGVTAWPGPAKPDGVLALTAGLAKLVVGEVGAVVVVTVCSVA
jgi:hypothetical protein